MTALQTCIHALIGCGVSFCHKAGNRLVINGKPDFLRQADLTAIRDNKPLLLHILPKDKTFTAADIANGLECYEERVAIMWNGGDGIEIEAAKNLAIPCTFRFMQSL